MNSKASNINLLLDKLKKYLNQVYLKQAATVLLRAVSIIFLLFLIISFAESFSFFNTDAKKIIGIVFLTILIVLIFPIFKMIYKIFASPKEEEIESASAQIGNHFPHVKDNLLNSLQLIKSDTKQSSEALVEAAFTKTFNAVKNLNFKNVIDYAKLKFLFRTTLLIIAAVLVFNLFNSKIRSASSRLINFDKTYKSPSEFLIKIFPGTVNIKKNDDVEIRLQASGNPPQNINLFTKNQFQTEFISQQISLDSNDIYTLNFPSVKNSFSYFAGTDKYKTPEYKINVLSPPQIINLSLEVTPPKYSKLPKVIQNENGNLSVLKGTRINYLLKSSNDLTSAVMKINDSTKIKLKKKIKSANINYTVSNPFEYYFEISDSNNLKNENPIKYSVDIIPDLYPEIEITNPESVSLLPQNDLVSIKYNIKDDFGFSKCILNYNVSPENISEDSQIFKKINLEISKSDLEQSLFYNWNLTRLFLKENEIVTFYIDVFDNDNISGPKLTHSNIIKIRVPTLNELFAEVENTQDNAIQDLTKTMKDAEELKKELEDINNELKKNDEKIDWNEKERIDQAVSKFNKVSKKVEEAKQKLNEMQNKMMQNNLLSEETMKKYDELQQLLDEFNTDELKKALERLQNSLKNMMRDNVQNSMENMAMNEKMFQKSLERTLNLLKQIQIEQKMDELIKRTEDITKNLDKLKKETKNSENDNSKDKKNKLSDKQNSVTKKLDQLKNEMEKLNNKMKEVEDSPQQQMESLNKKFDEQKNQELSKNSRQEIEQQNFENAMQMQNQLSQNMSEMKNSLQQMQQQMQQKNQSVVMQKMMRAIDNIIDLSKDQERLKNKLDNSLSQRSQFSEMMKQQLDLQQNLGNIFQQLDKLSQKTFAITPEMGQALGSAQRNMNQALTQLENKNGTGSSSAQGSAMKDLNDAADLVQNSLQNMMQNGGGQGGGMMSLMQQLQKLGQQQMGLNQQTREQLSMQQRAAMQRLARQQGTIRKSLEELNREARESGQSKRIAANLEQIANEMKEVISGLNTQKLNDDLIKKQNRILSKLLDAQRSINERDYEQNRESKSGTEFNRISPDKLILSDQEAKDILREELLKAEKEGYSKDYQDLIRRYFESLNKNVNKN